MNQLITLNTVCLFQTIHPIWYPQQCKGSSKDEGTSGCDSLIPMTILSPTVQRLPRHLSGHESLSQPSRLEGSLQSFARAEATNRKSARVSWIVSLIYWKMSWICLSIIGGSVQYDITEEKLMYPTPAEGLHYTLPSSQLMPRVTVSPQLGASMTSFIIV